MIINPTGSVGEAFEKVVRHFLEKGGFDVNVKVGEAFEKVAAPISREGWRRRLGQGRRGLRKSCRANFS